MDHDLAPPQAIGGKPLEIHPELPAGDVRELWDGLTLTFVAAAYGVLAGATATVVGASTGWRPAIFTAAALLAVALVIFGPARFKVIRVAKRYLRNAGRAPRG